MGQVEVGGPERLWVEVAYARPDRQWLLRCEVAAGARVRDVIRVSGLLRQCPEIDPDNTPLGIFSRPVSADERVQDGDRVEVYRPLAMDPREARRKRAQTQD